MLPHTEPCQWVKTGIEFVDGNCNISTVAADDWADWSLVPMHDDGLNKVTVEIERKGVSLWVYMVENGIRRAIREITWVFQDVEEDEEVHIGCYVARPTGKSVGSEEEDLEVWFEGFEVKILEAEK